MLSVATPMEISEPHSQGVLHAVLLSCHTDDARPSTSFGYVGMCGPWITIVLCIKGSNIQHCVSEIEDMRTIVTTNKSVAIGAFQSAVYKLFGVFHGNIHVSIQAWKRSFLCQCLHNIKNTYHDNQYLSSSAQSPSCQWHLWTVSCFQIMEHTLQEVIWAACLDLLLWACKIRWLLDLSTGRVRHGVHKLRLGYAMCKVVFYLSRN